MNVDELRQDPQGNYLILNRALVPVENINASEFGEWRCRGVSKGDLCDPTVWLRVAWGIARPPVVGLPVLVSVQRLRRRSFGSTVGIGGARSQDYNKLPEGVYRQVPLRGILYWNSHAFNLANETT